MAIWKSFLELPKEVLNAGILTSGCKLVTPWGRRVWRQDEIRMWF